MFNLGGDDKEKLKENMEEIKQLVESKEENSSQADNTSEDSFNPSENQQNNHSSDIADNLEQTQKPEPSKQKDTVGQAQASKKLVNQPSKEFKTDLKSISNEVRGLNRSKNNPSHKPTPPNNDNTLFLEVDEFNHVQEMVEEMRYLSREVEDLMSHLERGIEDSRRFESEVSEILNEFSDRRERIESSIN